MINLTGLSEDFPLAISEKEYQALISKKNRGWSHPESEKEWLAKLHYLRKGFKEGKIDRTSFAQREKELILNWWQRFVETANRTIT